MDLVSFTDEARRLSRPCRIFRELGSGSPSAYWHGLANAGLCLSLQHHHRWLNIHIDDALGGSVEIVEQPTRSAVPLFAEPAESLPPVDAVFRFGSDAVARFLREHDWPRDEPFNENFPDPTPTAYERVWQANCPLYQSGISLVSGGWHMAWPDGDWPDFVDHELFAWTLRDAEPWIEVFCKNEVYVVKHRVT